MKRSFKAVAFFTVLCLTPTSYARYYDPEYGRFLSRDEMEGALDSAPSLHRYTYAQVNPLRYTDPSGRSADSDWSSRRDIGIATFRAECRAGDASSCSAVARSHEAMDAYALATVGGMAAVGAAETVLPVLWEGTAAGPLVDAALAAGRSLLARTGVRAALYAAAGPLARLVDQVVGALDPSGALAPVSGKLARETDRALARSVRSYPITTTVEELKPPPLNVHMSSSGKKAPGIAEVAESIDAPGTTTYWHGTTLEDARKVQRGIDLSKGERNLDFDPIGEGSFYVTKDADQAAVWARRAAGTGGEPALVRYEVPNSELRSLEGKSFSTTDSEWGDFVRKSRSGGGGPEHHPFDFVEGPYVTNPRAAANPMSATPLKGRGHQLALCTNAAVCVFDASNPAVVPLE